MTFLKPLKKISASGELETRGMEGVRECKWKIMPRRRKEATSSLRWTFPSDYNNINFFQRKVLHLQVGCAFATYLKTQLKLQFHDHTFPFAHHIFTVLSNFLGLVQIGDDEGDEEPSEHRKKHKKSSHHHPHSHRCLIINFSCATFSGNHSACDSDDSFLIIYDEENLQGTLQRPVPGWFWSLVQASSETGDVMRAQVMMGGLTLTVETKI